MKRPRWLGSGESKEEETGDGDSAADSATDEGEESSAKPTAAERSARRTARKALGARVSGDDPPADGKAKKPAETKAKKPEAKRPVEPKKPVKAEKPVARKKPVESGKPSGGRKPRAEKPDEDEPKKLHRPRPQGDREPIARKSGSRDRGDTKTGEKGDGKTTERNRKRRDAADSKRERKPLGPRIRGAAVASAGALKRGAAETRKQVAVSAPKAGRRLLAALAAIFAIFFGVLGFLIGVLIAVGLVVARPIRWLLARLRRWTDAASRIATPTRVLALVVAGAAILLALSQYADYRSISIGNDAYSGVQTVAPAPETGRLPTGDPNSYVFVPIGIVCLLLLGGALTGRWRLCRLIALAGVAAIVVAIVVDRPAGLDTGDTALAFEGVRATLLGGFYAQIAAGVLLIGSSSLLARELRLAGATERAKPERGRKRSEKRRRAVPPPADTGGVRA